MQCAGIASQDEWTHVLGVELSVPLADRGERLTDSASIGELTEQPHERSAGTVLFQTTALTAATRQAVRNQAEMPEFSGCAEPAAQQLSVDDDGPAHSGSDGQQRHVSAAPARTESVLSPSRSICVIVDGDRTADECLELGAERHVSPVDIGGVIHL